MLKIISLLVFISGLYAQQVGTRPSIPGSAVWVAELAYDSTNGTQGPNGIPLSRYVSLTQNLQTKEWQGLGTTFTVEFWFNWKPPVTNPTSGAWDPVLSKAQNETQYLPIINRHPGKGMNNEWSHFDVHIVRTSLGGVLVAWAGCGCDYFPANKTPSEEQPNLQSCGLGYLLNSDSPNAIPRATYIVPGFWYHVAITFDGDGTETDTAKTHRARMYLNSNLLLESVWDAPTNNPFRAGVCKTRPMQWFRSDFGLGNVISLGYLDNQDDPIRRDPLGTLLNEPKVYGFNGYMDELRIWKVLRSEAQIKAWWDLELAERDIAAMQDILVAYYNWNLPIRSEDPNRAFMNQVTRNRTDATIRGDPWGTIQTWGRTLDNAALWQPAWQKDGNGGNQFLIISNKEYIKAKRVETSTKPINNTFTFRGRDADPASPSVNNQSALNFPALFPPHETFNYQIRSFSSKLRTGMANGWAKIAKTNGLAINDGNILGITLTQNETISIFVNCTDLLCTNIQGGFRDFFIEYWTTTPAPLFTPTAYLYFEIESECDGYYDSCGVCNGRNETCQCVVYHNFKNVRMAYVLLVYMLDYLVEKIDTTVQIMQESLQIVSKSNFNAAAMSSDVESQIRELMKFYNGCLQNYCQSIGNFNAELARIPFTFAKRDENDDGTLAITSSETAFVTPIEVEAQQQQLPVVLSS